MFPPEFGFKKQHALLTRFIPVYFRNFAEYLAKITLRFFSRDAFQVLFNSVIEKGVFEVLLSFFDFPRFLQLVYGISRGNP